jgi:hypothetical protein
MRLAAEMESLATGKETAEKLFVYMDLSSFVGGVKRLYGLVR